MLQLQRLMSSFLSLFYMPYIQRVYVCVCVYVCSWEENDIFFNIPFFENLIIYNKSYEQLLGDPSGRVSYHVGLRPFAWWDSGFESRRGYGCLSFVSVVNYQVEVSATGWSLVQKSPTACGGSECDRESSTVRRPWPIRDCCGMEKKINNYWKTLNNTWTWIKLIRYDN